MNNHEEKVIDLVLKNKKILIDEIAKSLNLNEDYIRGVVETLKREKVIKVEKEKKRIIKPGSKLVSLGTLPEILVFNNLRGKKKITVKELSNNLKIPENDLKVGVGKLIEQSLVKIEKRDSDLVITSIEKELNKTMKETSNFIEKLLKNKKLSANDLSSKEKEILDKLIKRPLMVVVEDRVLEYIIATEKTIEYLNNLKTLKTKIIITSLTPDIISKGTWKDVKFKKYNVKDRFFVTYPGKIHPLREIIREIREVFVGMGFEEAEGPLIELAFVNFDMLFQPQDHPAREMQDTFYLKSPEYGELEYTKEIIEKVKNTHLNGWKTGSTGWGGEWSIKEAKKLVLRTHTTSVSVKKVFETGEKPKKIFSIGRVFRNETVDYKHFVEFFQIDGIVIDKDANLRELMGVIQEFYNRLGFKDVKFWPSYFPYTEPSIQPSIFVEKWGKWLELGGAGIFRPEVTIPLGVKWPVLAWGLGVERLLMIKYDIDDIRTIYFNNLDWLRKTRLLV